MYRLPADFTSVLEQNAVCPLYLIASDSTERERTAAVSVVDGAKHVNRNADRKERIDASHI